MPPRYDPNERPQTEVIAREIIHALRHDRGHIDANDEIELSKTSPEWQEDYRRREEIRRNVYARYTKTVADQLYSSRFRFIPEILQNADDAEYLPNVSPTLTFRVRSTELLVDSNERGFTVANVQAICATGESSKVDNVNTTGEKGLGFKSIFGVANKIHIQSGRWSFRFEHTRGQDGLGMVTPIWTDPSFDPLPVGIGTRFKLTYARQTEAFLGRIVEEFDKLTDTIVFGLRKLKKLVIVFEDVRGRDYAKSFERKSMADFTLLSQQMSIFTNIVRPSAPPSSHETRLRIVRKTVEDMPFDEWRQTTSSEVILAFQTNLTSGDPIIPPRGQHVFAYLPVQRMAQLPFIIQADFVLAANREAIPENDWNNDLRDGIADAFVEAVASFCKIGDPLFYRWMEYLPASDNDGFWEGFYQDIVDRLSSRPILESRTRRWLKHPYALRSLPSRFLFDGKPLVPDLATNDLYLSEKYSRENIEKLRDLGLLEIASNECLERIRVDCELEHSQLRVLDLESNWHTKFLSFIDYLLGQGFHEEIKRLTIIPLTTGDWVSLINVERNPIHLPYVIDEDTVQIQIPGNIGLQKLHLKACVLSDRKSVYARLGISDCDPDLVVKKILDAQTASPSGTTADYVGHFEILFWFGKSSVFLKGVDERVNLTYSKHLFFRSSVEYDAVHLLGQAPITDVVPYGFIHDLYMTSPVRNSLRHRITWMQWLEKSAGVRYYPELLNDAHVTMHPLLEVTARDDSTKFISGLHAHWRDSYEHSLACHPSPATSKFRHTPVLCQNGETIPLSKTLLPTPEAIRRSHEYGIKESLPFLALPADVFAAGVDSWYFLRRFRVICNINLDFCFAILDCLKTLQRSEAQITHAVVGVYKTLGEISTLGDAQTLQSRFDSSNYIFVPGTTVGSPWRPVADCVWKGPSVVSTKKIISDLYQTEPEVSRLFRDLLELRDANYKDVLDSLVTIRGVSSTSVSPALVRRFYETLSAMTTAAEESELRRMFESRSLIHANGHWIKPSEAVWNCKVELAGRRPIGEIYPTLRSFFLNRLGVSIVNAKLLLQALTNASGPANSPDGAQIRDIMINAGQILAVEQATEDLKHILQELKRNRFLPIRRGQGWTFAKATANFFIIDHERYGSAFRNKLDLLDFTYAELTCLDPLFKLLGLKQRYLSRHVDTETVVDASYRDPDLTSHFQQRAYTLSCCAISHQSPKYFNESSNTHEMLLSAEVFLSDDMCTRLIVKLLDQDVEARSDRSLVKIEQLEGRLKICVPSNEAGFYSCYRTELPAELVSILGIEDAKAEKQVYRIMNDEAMSLDTVMKDEDIPDVAWLAKPPAPPSSIAGPVPAVTAQDSRSPAPTSFTVGRNEASEPSTPSPTYDEGIDDQNPSVPRPVTSLNSASNSTATVVRVETLRSTLGSGNNLAAPIGIPFQSTGLLQRVAQNNSYRQLLRHVVRQARRSISTTRQGQASDAPGSNPFSLSGLEDVLDDLDPNSINLRQALGFSGYEPVSFAETARLGAAGELFVFERLRGAGFPDFTIDNWQSTIRSNVNALPEYADLQRWPAPEVSDFVYETDLNMFEQFLRGQSFNQFPIWTDTFSHPIRYLIEVKTTTGPCSTPFFMSKNQYQLMRQHALSTEPAPITRPETVYMIFRIYNLLSNNIGMAIFVDPWQLKDNVLEFVADPWKVIAPDPPMTT